MRSYLENIPAKFDPDPILIDGNVGFFWRGHPQQEQEEEQDE